MGVSDEIWMAKALDLARLGAAHDEVPVAALLVLDGQQIAHAYNAPRGLCDPTAHAEILCLRQAAKAIANYRLLDATLYVTLEPCMMCASAMVHARIKRLVFAAFDNKTGVVESVDNFFERPYLNHRIDVLGGIGAEPSRLLLQDFFKQRRQQKKCVESSCD